MVWQEVTPLLRGNIAVNSLGVPDLKSILERIVVRVCANNPVSEWIGKWGLSIDELIERLIQKKSIVSHGRVNFSDIIFFS